MVFLETNHPTVCFYGDGPTSRSRSTQGQATKVRISFCREKGDRDRDRDRPAPSEDDWICHSVCWMKNAGLLCADVLSAHFQTMHVATSALNAKVNVLVCLHDMIQLPECQLTGVEIPATVNVGKYQFINTGDSDVSPDGTPSQFLLFRGLEATVTAQLLAKGAAKLYKSSGGSSPPPNVGAKKSGAKVSSTTAESNLGAREGSLRRVLLVKDRRTDESWRYGFVEFASVEVCLHTLYGIIL